MKRFFLIVIPLLLASISAYAQLYVPGETLNYRMSYRAKLFPNTEVAKVTMRTIETTLDGQPAYIHGFLHPVIVQNTERMILEWHKLGKRKLLNPLIAALTGFFRREDTIE